MRALAALLVLAALAGCATRERSNPFDPVNPVTGGKPAGLTAIGGSGYVELRWASAAVSGNVGYRIARRIGGAGPYVVIVSELPIASTSYFDLSVQNGTRYDYQLSYVFDGTNNGAPAEDYATPGTRRPWVSDQAGRRILRLSHDGRQIADVISGFFGPSFVTYDGRNHRIWVSDTYDGTVTSIDRDDVSRVTISGLIEPVAIGLDGARDDLWICDQARDAIYHFTLSGQVRSPETIGPIDTPIGIAVDLSDGSLWVCERGGNRVLRFLRSGTPNGSIDQQAPSRVAVDSIGRDAWVTSFEGGRVVRISAGGVVQDTVPLLGPIGIDIDPRRGRIWVADAVAGEVVALRRSGLVEFRVAGLDRVREVAVDLASGECWATVAGLRQVVRISATGAVLERATGVGDAYGIAIDPGQP